MIENQSPLSPSPSPIFFFPKPIANFGGLKMSDRFAVIPTSPFPGWDREVPRYRVARSVRPSPNDRFKHELPFSSCSENDVWQYAARIHKVGEIIETKEWPHPSFRPLNFSAKKTLDFFNSAPKSRLARTPWSPAHGRLVLDDGLTGTHPNFAAILAPRTAA